MEKTKEAIINSENKISRKTNRIKSIFSFKFLNKIIFSLVVASIVFYVAGMNDLTVKGFHLQELRVEGVRLQEENRKVKSKIVELESFQHLSQETGNLNMVAAGDNIHYIISTGGAGVVAKR